MVPSSNIEPIDEVNRAILSSLGIQASVKNTIPSGTFTYYTHQKYQARAFTLELGKVYTFGNNDLSKFEATKRGLIDLLTNKQSSIRSPVMEFYVSQELIKENEAYKFYIDSKEQNFTVLEANQKIDSKHTANGSERILFPNPNVQLGQRTGLLISSIESS